jgi:DNA-binding HxlR family transcriptional regulator
MDRVVQLLAGPWTTYILWTLHQEKELHFGALRRSLHGISAKVLTQRLRRLEREGLVERTPLESSTRVVLYRLSRRGRELRRALDALDAVGRRWAGEDAAGAL